MVACSNFNSQAAGAALAETSNGDQAAAAAKAAATAFSKGKRHMGSLGSVLCAACA